MVPRYIYGLHDLGGEDLMLGAAKPGWILHTTKASDPAPDFSALAERGLRFIVRLNHGYEEEGTIPPSNQYNAFAQACANYVDQSRGAHIWLIGNEMNLIAERPRLPDGSREVITPDKYARCFTACRSAIKSLPGHEQDWVVPGAVGPYNAETGDWVQYMVDVLNKLPKRADAIALHCYTHQYTADQIALDSMMNPPYENRHFDFRAYRDFLNAVPASFRTLPVLITETNPYAGWRDADVKWIQAAYAEIDAWNADAAHQPIFALVLFRWSALADHPEWGIEDKRAVRQDFLAALQKGYAVPERAGRPESVRPEPVGPGEPTQPSGPGTAQTHVVQPGETLSAIARRFGTSVSAIVVANNILNPNLIRAGQVLVIPAVTSRHAFSFAPAPTTELAEAPGWCPFAIKRPVIASNFGVGREGMPVRAVVLHIVAGKMANVFNTFNNPDKPVSAHFCVGKDGKIEQYVSINDSAYGNGLGWIDGHWAKNRGTRENPKWISIKPTWQDIQSGDNPNLYTISIEHDGQPGDEWTPEMDAANNRLLQWIAEQCALTYVPHRTLIGHCEIDPLDKANCPGPHVNYEQIAAAANAVVESPEREGAIQATRDVLWLPINTNSALYKFAQANRLGCPQTDEFEFQADGARYVGQVYTQAVVFVKKGEWGNVAWTPKTQAGAGGSEGIANLALSAAAQRGWMPINIDSALYKFAQARDLGCPQTDEIQFTVANTAYVAQAFVGGLVYAEKTNLARIAAIAKPEERAISFAEPAVEPGLTRAPRRTARKHHTPVKRTGRTGRKTTGRTGRAKQATKMHRRGRIAHSPRRHD